MPNVHERELDFSRCRLTPFAHQREDTLALMQHPYYFIASEMRTGKSAIVVLASQFLFTAHTIDRVIIISPAPVREVWADEDLGEIAKHHWTDIPITVVNYHERTRIWDRGEGDRRLQFLVTNYEWLINEHHLKELIPFADRRTLLVLDESSFIRTHDAARTKACFKLRKRSGRIVLLNGTPIFNSPMDLYTQGNILHPSVLDCQYLSQYKARYALQEAVLTHDGKPLKKEIVVGGRKVKEITIQQTVGWTNLEDLQQRLAPYVVRRLQSECLDLPPKLDPVMLTATLTPDTWKYYKAMRRDLVVWLGEQVSLSSTAAVKVMRLSQITSGILGGVENPNISPAEVKKGLLESLILPGLIPEPEPADVDDEPVDDDLPPGVRTVGREKLDVLLWFIEQRLEADANLHLVAWSRFRIEAQRAYEEVTQRFPQFQCALLMGGQNKTDRKRALSLLKPETSPEGPVFVSGVEGTGSFGLDMTAAHTCITLSSGYSPGLSMQTLDRVYGPNQKHPIAYFEIIATGPKGQLTIDRDIITTRRSGENIAMRTSAAWIKTLERE